MHNIHHIILIEIIRAIVLPFQGHFRSIKQFTSLTMLNNRENGLELAPEVAKIILHSNTTHNSILRS